MTEADILRLLIDKLLQTENRPFRFIVIPINGRASVPKALVKIKSFPQIKTVSNIQLV